jgi:hypothetical protein
MAKQGACRLEARVKTSKRCRTAHFLHVCGGEAALAAGVLNRPQRLISDRTSDLKPVLFDCGNRHLSFRFQRHQVLV